VERLVREMEIAEIPRIVRYFHDAESEFLNQMGVDPGRLPGFDEWCDLIRRDIDQPVESKSFYYLIWEIDGTPSGHSNINKIVYGKEAYMHLHLWRPQARKSGHGQWLANESIPRYFEQFRLERLCCEPYANPMH